MVKLEITLMTSKIYIVHYTSIKVSGHVCLSQIFFSLFLVYKLWIRVLLDFYFQTPSFQRWSTKRHNVRKQLSRDDLYVQRRDWKVSKCINPWHHKNGKNIYFLNKINKKYSTLLYSCHVRKTNKTSLIKLPKTVQWPLLPYWKNSKIFLERTKK